MALGISAQVHAPRSIRTKWKNERKKNSGNYLRMAVHGIPVNTGAPLDGWAASSCRGFGENNSMIGLLVQWVLCAIALLVVSRIVPGFYVEGLWPAMIASLVIGLLNATLGLFLKILTFPLSILTLGLFLLVINGIMILVASSIVRGFHVQGFVPAFWGAVVLALLGMVIRALTRNP
jgi:putative membrane protein